MHLLSTREHNKLATMVSVPAPAPFLLCSGEPAIPFVTWRKNVRELFAGH